jgi:hypothetical protein
MRAHVTAAHDAKDAVLRRAIYDLALGWRPPSNLETAGKVAIDMILGLSPITSLAGVALELREAEEKRATWGALLLKMLDIGKAAAQ